MINLSEVLLKFGIDYDQLTPVPLEQYHWWAIHGTDSNSPLSFSLSPAQPTPPSLPRTSSFIEIIDLESTVKLSPITDSLKHPLNVRVEDDILFSTVGNISPTISQRIRSMARRARTRNTTPQT